MAVVITSYSPLRLSSQGGELVTLVGTFPTATAIAVTMDGVGCYSGVVGQGDVIYSEDGETLSFVTPPSDTGTLSVEVTDTVDLDQIDVAVIEAPLYSAVHRMRRNFPPWYGLGARMAEFEP